MKKVLLMAFTAFVMLSACKKDKSEKSETLHTCATVTEKDGSELYTSAIKFDDHGRVKTADGGEWSVSHEYSPNKIVATLTSPNWTNITTHTLDEKGRIIKSVNDDANDPYEINYEYNNDGYLVKETYISTGGTNTSTSVNTYTWVSGNLVRIAGDYLEKKITYGSDVISGKLVTDNIVTYGDKDSANEYLTDYFGKRSKNAPVKVQDGNYKPIIYSYTKDSKGNIIGYTETEEGETTPRYTYTLDYDNCN